MVKKITVLAVLGAVAATGCSVNSDALDQKEKKDAKRAPESHIDNSAPAKVLNNSNGFSNVTVKCGLPGYAVYTTSRGTKGEPSRLVVVEDPQNC
jgi:hypothetical protein